MITYSRLVFGFHQAAFNTAIVRQTVEAAGLLDLELHGIYVRDPELMGAARLSGLREIRLLGNRVETMDIGSLADSIEAAAKRARDLVETEAANKKVRSRFEVLTSAVGEAMQAAAKASDIVVLSQPDSALERSSEPYRQYLQAVSQSKSAVLLLPRRYRSGGGRILALARTPEDKSIDMARTIAERVHGQAGVEDLRNPHHKSHSAQKPSERERLVIATREPGNNMLFSQWLDLIGERKAPVLLLPGEEPTAE
jgi:G3E family GTPase